MGSILHSYDRRSSLHDLLSYGEHSPLRDLLLYGEHSPFVTSGILNSRSRSILFIRSMLGARRAFYIGDRRLFSSHEEHSPLIWIYAWRSAGLLPLALGKRSPLLGDLRILHLRSAIVLLSLGISALRSASVLHFAFGERSTFAIDDRPPLMGSVLRFAFGAFSIWRSAIVSRFASGERQLFLGTSHASRLAIVIFFAILGILNLLSRSILLLALGERPTLCFLRVSSFLPSRALENARLLALDPLGVSSFPILSQGWFMSIATQWMTILGRARPCLIARLLALSPWGFLHFPYSVRDGSCRSPAGRGPY
ncbi:hypothetical protein COLO4_35479 [Corchorus olitorius]|uniref:Uncharacterized protein n=1 Tax=Corchorus olitorius TaxID=93759 RepID=A0A1R3GGI0_9ROSI|nr:hypothetical protein COLO4_35479 [Corchorus olitorius]